MRWTKAKAHEERYKQLEQHPIQAGDVPDCEGPGTGGDPGRDRIVNSNGRIATFRNEWMTGSGGFQIPLHNPDGNPVELPQWAS